MAAISSLVLLIHSRAHASASPFWAALTASLPEAYGLRFSGSHIIHCPQQVDQLLERRPKKLRCLWVDRTIRAQFLWTHILYITPQQGKLRHHGREQILFCNS